jgi:two-component system phosphate regulon sensor histidine kinase PhoR
MKMSLARRLDERLDDEPILATVEALSGVELLSGSGSIDVLRAVGLLLDPGIVGIDARGRVLLANEPARRLLGLELLEGSDFVAGEVDYRLIRLLDAARQSGHVEERAITLHDRDFNARAIALDGEVATVLMVRDETRVHHLERVRRDFVSNVSHELRTPITAVQLIAETLANGGLEDPAAAAGFVRRIGQEASHMAQMVEELLELSTIESGLRPMASERVPIGVLMGSLDRLRPLAESKGVAFDIGVAPGTPDLIGDASHLGQVLRNLAHNAIKFTPSGGRIAISAAPGATGHVMLSCRDTGVGITPADLPRIYERFWKADSSRQRDGEGSGLGLAIVRHVVEAHGGTVTVTSEPGRGTEFQVVLPAAEDEPTRDD